MRFPWVIVGGTGYDVEDIGNPRTHDMECPSCGKNVRFAEKELIKNLRVFGVALVGVEKGRRVFECPHCKVCVEPPDEETLTEQGSAKNPQLEIAKARLAKLDDEVWLWGQREKMAAEKGARDLEFEALEWKTKAEREADALRELIARMSAGSAPAERKTERENKGPAIVARKGGEIVDRGAEDEFAALKSKLARKQADTPTEASSPNETHAEPVATERKSDAEEEAKPPSVPDVEHDFAALKAKLAQRGPDTQGSRAEYDSLRSEMTRPTANAPSTATPATETATPPPADDDDDPVAALKRKLRGK